MKVSFLISLWFFSSALAIQDYCQTGFKPFGDKPLQLDLNKLNQDFTIFQNETIFPSTKSIVTQVNICDGLTIPKEEKTSETNCLQGTYICQRVIYNKNNKDDIVEIHNIAGELEKSSLKPEFKAIKPEDDSKANGYQYSLIMYGDNGQSANVVLECDTSKSREEKAENPSIVSYYNKVLTLSWKTVFACTYDEGKKQPDIGDGGKSGDGEKKKEGKTIIGIFFTSLFVLLAIYFVGGAIYNMKVYNARGLDLIPHRDFWLDLPYLIRDLIAHAFDYVMSRRRGGGGYVAV